MAAAPQPPWAIRTSSAWIGKHWPRRKNAAAVRLLKANCVADAPPRTREGTALPLPGASVRGRRGELAYAPRCPTKPDAAHVPAVKERDDQ